MKVSTKAIIRKSISHDRLSIDVKFPTGASFRYYASRNGSRITVAFSNNREELLTQTEVVKRWDKFYGSETYGQKIDRLENIMSNCTSGASVIEAMIKDMKGEEVSNG